MPRGNFYRSESKFIVGLPPVVDDTHRRGLVRAPGHRSRARSSREMSGKTPWTPLASNDDEDDDRELMLHGTEQRSTSPTTSPTTEQAESRPTRDARWKYAFVLTNALTAIVGLSAIGSASRDARELSKPETLRAWATCHDANTGAAAVRRTLLATTTSGEEGEDDDTAFGAAFGGAFGGARTALLTLVGRLDTPDDTPDDTPKDTPDDTPDALTPRVF